VLYAANKHNTTINVKKAYWEKKERTVLYLKQWHIIINNNFSDTSYNNIYFETSKNTIKYYLTTKCDLVEQKM